MTIDYFECSACGTVFSAEAPLYVCPRCNGNLDCHLDFERPERHFDPHQILNDPRGSIWRYERLLPVGAPPFQATPLHQVGCTPVYQPERLTKALGMSRLWVKDESRNPSASFKDRASAVVIARALETGIGTIVAASTGNAGAATACMAASVGLPAIILAPRSAPPAKVAQLLAFGAQVFLVEGTYDEAFDLSIQASDAFGWYNRNTGYNPFTVEGKKTAAFEIWEQLISTGKVNPAELTIYIPVGDGNIISGIAKGFKDLLRLGWIDQLPRLAGVQAEGSAAIARAFAARTDQILPVQAQTIADSISVDLPRDGSRALKSVRESGGFFVTVTDEEILHAIPELGSSGLFVEPAAAAAWAGLRRALQDGLQDPAAPVLVLCTGSGLKDVRAVSAAVAPAPVIAPTISALEAAIHE